MLKMFMKVKPGVQNYPLMCRILKPYRGAIPLMANEEWHDKPKHFN